MRSLPSRIVWTELSHFLKKHTHKHQQSATPWETKHSFGSAKYKIISFIHRTLFFLPALQLTHDCTANINRANVWNYSSSLEKRRENVTLNIKIKGNFGLLCINFIFFSFLTELIFWWKQKSYNQRHTEQLQSKITKTISQYKPKPDVRRGF